MSKTERAKQKTFADDYAQYAVPKKPHKALYAVAGVAGAAAVLAGGVFGLKFLAEHGGLKGPDVQGSVAGYHEDAAVTAETEPDVTEAVTEETEAGITEAVSAETENEPEGTDITEETSEEPDATDNPDMEDFSPATEWMGLEIGKKLEFKDYYATFKTFRTSGIFTELYFDIEFKDRDKIVFPIMNLGEESWYCVDGAPFDSKVYAMGYHFVDTGTYTADYSLVVYNGLAPGESLDLALYGLNFVDGEKPEYVKGADITLTGMELTEEAKPYEAYPGLEIGKNMNGSAILDHIIIDGWGVRFDITYTENEELELKNGITSSNPLFNSVIVLKYKDGTTHELKLIESNVFADTVNSRQMAYLFDRTDAQMIPYDLESAVIKNAEGIETVIF